MFIKIVGPKNTSVIHQGYVSNTDNTKVKIFIDFSQSWKARITVNGETFMDLNQMKDLEQKQKILDVINTSGAGSSPSAVFDPSRIMDDNSTDTFLSFAVYGDPKAVDISPKSFSVNVSNLTVNGVNVKSQLTGYDLTLADLPYIMQLEDQS